MFQVENADFIADKLAAELLPNQEFREVLKNALEAVERRLADDGLPDGGRVEFDVDWPLLERDGRWFISCADNGDGMSRVELDRYMTTLAVHAKHHQLNAEGRPAHQPQGRAEGRRRNQRGRGGAAPPRRRALRGARLRRLADHGHERAAPPL
jgi:phage/plasmid primase-like uncharacterized protein